MIWHVLTNYLLSIITSFHDMKYINKLFLSIISQDSFITSIHDIFYNFNCNCLIQMITIILHLREIM